MQGSPEIEKYMKPVREALDRHHTRWDEAWTDIWNRAYSAVMRASRRENVALPKDLQAVIRAHAKH